MSQIKAVLWDADGVLNLPEEFFSVMYAKSRGIDPLLIEPFFKTQEYENVRLGRADLKDYLTKNLDMWQWQGTADELLKIWLKSESIRNEELVDYVQKLRREGLPCYLATNQEKYRGEYMKAKMFPGEFDDYFVSADMGVEKPNPEFFQIILNKLKIPPENIAYFDDTPGHIEAAKKLGIQAYLYESLDHVQQVLKK